MNLLPKKKSVYNRVCVPTFILKQLAHQLNIEKNKIKGNINIVYQIQVKKRKRNLSIFIKKVQDQFQETGQVIVNYH